MTPVGRERLLAARRTWVPGVPRAKSSRADEECDRPPKSVLIDGESRGTRQGTGRHLAGKGFRASAGFCPIATSKTVANISARMNRRQVFLLAISDVFEPLEFATPKVIDTTVRNLSIEKLFTAFCRESGGRRWPDPNPFIDAKDGHLCDDAASHPLATLPARRRGTRPSAPSQIGCSVLLGIARDVRAYPGHPGPGDGGGRYLSEHTEHRKSPRTRGTS